MPVEKIFPSIKTLFQDSWQAMTGSLLNLFVLTLLGGGIWFVIMIVLLIGTVGLGIISTIVEKNQNIELAMTQYLSQLSSSTGPKVLAGIGFGVLGLIIISCLIAVVTSVASVYAVANYQQKPKLGECLKQGFKLFLPLILINLLVGLISFGGWFLFLIPGLLMMIFFSFAGYELILSNKRFFHALKGSVQLVSQHFGEIFGRVILIFIASCILSYVIQKTIPFLSFIYYLVINWFGIAYHMVLYKQAKAVTDENEQPKMGWIWITGILGWLIALLIGFGLFKLAQTPAIKDKISGYTQELIGGGKKSETQIIEGYVNSINTEAKPYWDQSVELFKQIKATDNVGEIKKLSDQNIAALKKATELDPRNPELWSGLCSANTWASTTGSLEEGLKACQKAEELAPELKKYIYNTGDTLMQLSQYARAAIQFEKVLRIQEDYGYGHFSLGMAYKNLKMQDSAKQHLQKAIDIWSGINKDGKWDADILLARKELETVGTVTPTTSNQTVPAAPSCTRYQIREGEFASNKCYSNKDYDDLIYYLQRFNSAAASYNGAAASMSITCSGSDFFKNQCEQDKKDKADAEANINNYRGIINGIIARGK